MSPRKLPRLKSISRREIIQTVEQEIEDALKLSATPLEIVSLTMLRDSIRKRVLEEPAA